MVKRVMYGEIVHDHVSSMQDLSKREIFILTALAVPILVFGVWPDPIVEVMHQTIEGFLVHISSKLS